MLCWLFIIVICTAIVFISEVKAIDRINVSFPESVPVNSSRLLNIPSGTLGLQSISIIGGNEYDAFFLSETRFKNVIKYVNLVTLHKLDRENVSQYELSVEAVFKNVAKYLLVHVTVIDVNDNPPIFVLQDEEYEVSIPTNIAPGSAVTQITAFDADTGKNGIVNYYLGQEYIDYFSIDKYTGNIKTKARLQCIRGKKCPPCFETGTCSVLIYANDKGSQPHSSQKILRINLINSNDHAPKISFNYNQNQSNLEWSLVSDNSPPETYVAAISVSDRDKGHHGQIAAVEIQSGNEDNNFYLESTDSYSLYILRVSPGAQFKKNIYDLIVRATDAGTPQISSEAHLLIKVNEVTSFKPFFLSEKYFSKLSEDVVVGTPVLQVAATDKETTGNKVENLDHKIIYTIVDGNAHDWFKVHPYSGLITTKSAIDRETQDQVNLRIQAKNQHHLKESFVMVQIIILDVNDNIPMFDNMMQKYVKISEGVTSFTHILNISAFDPDLGENGTVKFSIDGQSSFKIDSQSGQIFSTIELDRETQPTYNLKIVATDGQGLNSNMNLVVKLLDINDNSPFFYPKRIYARLDENDISVVAHDLDEGINGKITYTWKDPNEVPSGIELDKSTGKITFDRRLDLLSFRSVILKVKAEDNGGRKSRGFATLNLFGNDWRVRESFEKFKILEEQLFPYDVGQIRLDRDFRGELIIVDGDPEGMFSINNTGFLRTVKRVDREDNHEAFHLKIIVLTRDEISFSATYDIVVIDIDVVDINDNLPIFDDSQNNSFIIRSSAPVGQPIFRAQAFDFDKGPNSSISFKFVAQNIKSQDENVFDINATSGVVRLKTALTEAIIRSRKSFDLLIKVTDTWFPFSSSKKLFTVSVADENLHTPAFDFDHYEISIPENVPMNTRFLSMAAVDIDKGIYGSIIYNIIDGDQSKFGIFPDGDLYVKDILDYEKKSHYAIEVQASDPDRSSYATVSIYVEDKNDNPPIFTKRLYKMSISENEPSGLAVGRVSADDEDTDRNAELFYSFLADQVLTNYFTIDSQYGFISTISSIDREKLMLETGQDLFQFDVVVSDNGLTRMSDTATVAVVVNDENDNVPMFSKNVYRAQISENEPVGTVILSVHATDVDKDENGKISYSLAGKSSFYVDSTNGEIILQKSLDYEVLSSHSVTVIASDMGSPLILTSTALLYITVLDENDNAPVFTSSSSLSIPISEDSMVGQYIYQFEASDLDFGNNGKIRYILGGEPFRSAFHLDSTTGILRLVSELDRERHHEPIKLNVTAFDNGSPMQSTTLDVFIRVTDINDNAPAFRSVSSVLRIGVREDETIGTVIHTIHAFDPDDGLNGQFTFSLTNFSPDFPFNIDSETGDILVSSILDREQVSVYRTNVVVTDKGLLLQLSTQVLLIIEVEDVNDNAPDIVSLNTALLFHDTPAGSRVLTVRATDPDEGSNGLVEYILTAHPEVKQYFSVDPISGHIFLSHYNADLVDRIIHLTVIANDKSVERSKRQTSSVQISIVVVANSEKSKSSSVFTMETYKTSIVENRPINTLVGQVNYTNVSQRPQFYLIACESQKGGDNRGIFVVDRDSGEVKSARVIDREVEGDLITLDIIAVVDGAITSSCKMEVRCIDENDFAPQFPSDFQLSISESDLTGHVIATIDFRDDDTASEDTLVYSLQGFEAQKFLSIEKVPFTKTAVLKIIESIDREEFASINVVIVASDGRYSTYWNQTIQIDDFNDNAPTFNLSHFSFDVSENSERGAIIGRLQASDVDVGNNAKLTYSLTSEWGSNIFSLDPVSGVIRLVGELDYEDIPHYILKVSVSDTGSTILTTITTVYLNVLDVNDNSPIFDKFVYVKNVGMHTPIGSEILQLRATDADSSQITNLTYRIIKEEQNSIDRMFSITDSGSILTKVPLDGEIASFYSFQVEVSDSNSLPPLKRIMSHTTRTLVNITVINVKTSPPIFEPLPLKIFVLENSPAHTSVVVLRAFNSHSGLNSGIEYRLEDSMNGIFSIGRIDGVVRTNRPVDRENSVVEYELSIVAIDANHLSSRLHIRVYIEDVDDNVPVFSRKRYSESVFENASIGFVVARLNASDRDPTSRLRYAITGGDKNREFSIGERDGNVRVKKLLDFERKKAYEISVQVEDGAGHFDTASLSITILDINDNAPACVDSPYFVQIMENYVPSSLPVFILNGKDLDESPNFSKIMYSFDRTSVYHAFDIDSMTGAITVNFILDREINSHFSFKTFVTDSGNPRLTGTCVVNIDVLDENDNAPIFENEFFQFTVMENIDPGHNISIINAKDADTGDNARITYKLEGTESFSIDKYSGQLYTNSFLDREEFSQHTFFIVATNSYALNPLSSRAKILVIVGNKNDNKPKIQIKDFRNPSYYVPTILKPGDFIMGADARDRDIGSRLIFKLSGRDKNFFSINRDNGVVTASNYYPSHENDVTFEITLIVLDYDENEDDEIGHYDKITIVIIPIPTFTVPQMDDLIIPDSGISIPENTVIGSKILTVRAHSDDSANIRYAIAGGNVGGIFEVDEITGDVSISKSLDFEVTSYFELWIEAHYEDKSLFFTSVKAIIKVEDVNDNAPNFGVAFYNFHVSEVMYAPYLISKIEAYDLDSGEYGLISYKLKLENEDNGKFELESSSGRLSLKSDLDRETKDQYKFKVIAYDHGDPEKSSSITIIITVEDVNDNALRFENIYRINVTENTKIGTVLLTVKAKDIDLPINDDYVNYMLDSGNHENVFAVNRISGELIVNARLDREIRDMYTDLNVEATDGLRKVKASITINILDQNDNEPNFDKEVYQFDYFPVNSTNMPFGKVYALDRDAIGPNSQVTYSILSVTELFEIDSNTGELFASLSLKRLASQSKFNFVYNFTIIASDEGIPRMSSKCRVSVNVINVENKAPLINIKRTTIALPIGLNAGTIVQRLNVTDDTVSASSLSLVYNIVSDNSSSLFTIHDDGTITNNRDIDVVNIVYVLTVNVQDKGEPPMASNVTLSFIITGINHHSPKFPSNKYVLAIKENEKVGSILIKTIAARDEDYGMNGQLQYAIISGNVNNTFFVDSQNGNIILAKTLDYEILTVYNITVQAKDFGFFSRSSISNIELYVKDVDDNYAFFDQVQYDAYLYENAPVGTVVTQMFATDRDTEENVHIVYSTTTAEQFEIDPKSGIVKSLVVFDFEHTPFINIRIRAGSGKNSETLLRIAIIGENEFYPQFVENTYTFYISESSPVGTKIGRVTAADNDHGQDGIVFYYFVGSSNSAGFSIDHLTGDILIDKRLDREIKSKHSLTVLAKNFGSIRGNDIDMTFVTIVVQDGNDPPVFTKAVYTVEIPENVPFGSHILNVTAVDGDFSRRNYHFSYQISGGNEKDQFSISSTSGAITVVGSLDRERIDTYNLTVSAVDQGTPPATGKTIVLIYISDVNDNPPLIPEHQRSMGKIRENSSPGSYIMQLSATDLDLVPNPNHFKYILVDGEHSGISLDSTSGILRTTRSFDREVEKLIHVDVKVEDSGRPPLSAVYGIKINVLDENDNPSQPRNVDITIKNYKGTFAGGFISSIRPNDRDISGVYDCRLLQGPQKIFTVEKDCRILAGRIKNGRKYNLKLSINDGLHGDVEVNAKLTFISFSEFAVGESVVVRFSNVTSSQVLTYFNKLNAVSNFRHHDLLEIISLREPSKRQVYCFVILKQNGGKYASKQETISYVSKSLHTNFNFFKVDYDPCDESPCQHFGRCTSEKRVLNTTEIAESENSIFNSPTVKQFVKCFCTEEYTGIHCQHQKNPCFPNPCLYNGECRQNSNSFQCICAPSRGGKRCEQEKVNMCLSDPCLNGGSCTMTSAGYFCNCHSAYIGDNCEILDDRCRDKPCLNGGTCSLNKNGYICICPDNFYGLNCHLSTFGFDLLSYIAFPTLDVSNNDISVIFSTLKSNSLLVYNFGVVNGGRSDFIALELIMGHPRFSWGSSRTSITRLEVPARVDTGRWYKIIATRNNQKASLTVEDCFESGESCKTCSTSNLKCFNQVIGSAGALVFSENPMYFGGVPTDGELTRRASQIASDDFVGCVRSITINGIERNIFAANLNSSGISQTCNRIPRDINGECDAINECGSSTCHDMWSHTSCSCGSDKIRSADCDQSFTPFTLTKEHYVEFIPTSLYRRMQNLPLLYRNSEVREMSVAFRTFSSDANLITSYGHNLMSFSRIEIVNSVLVLVSKRQGKTEINMTSGVYVSDGIWHSARLVDDGKFLRMEFDGNSVGYDIEVTAAHDFVSSAIKKFVLGSGGFRGCMTNFTLNNEIHPLKIKQIGYPVRFRVKFSSGYSSIGNGCDVEAVKIHESTSVVDVGVAVVIVFFVVILLGIFCLFAYYKLRHRFIKLLSKGTPFATAAYSNNGADLSDSSHLNNLQLLQRHTNSQNPAVPLPKVKKLPPKPDILNPTHNHSLRRHEAQNDIYRQSGEISMMPLALPMDEAEHYDIDNASSIAPSDIDIVCHYKDYRSGRGAKLATGRPGRNHQNTPLARLSPSSEISRNTPRIITLGDISGKMMMMPHPPSSMGHTDRSLNSPMSHITQSSRSDTPVAVSHQINHNKSSRGLTSENVARFNKNSTLVNTLDMLSMGSEKTKKTFATSPATKSPIEIRSNLSSSDSDDSDQHEDDESFTCSEFEYNNDDDPSSNNMSRKASAIFSKHVNLRQINGRNDEDCEAMSCGSSIPTSWENLLSWSPNYDSLAGVFNDIAELPHNNFLQSEFYRPQPVGNNCQTEEEYI